LVNAGSPRELNEVVPLNSTLSGVLAAVVSCGDRAITFVRLGDNNGPAVY
jgi:hypothetical protein